MTTDYDALEKRVKALEHINETVAADHQAAHNAAIEEAAGVADGIGAKCTHFDDEGVARGIAAAIRELKR